MKGRCRGATARFAESNLVEIRNRGGVEKIDELRGVRVTVKTMSMGKSLYILTIATGFAGLMGFDASASTLPADRLVAVGDTVEGILITQLNQVHTNGVGEGGFTGVLEDGDRFVWLGDGVVWRNSDSEAVLTGAEVTMGHGDNGEFVYSTAYYGEDAIWTHNGLLTAEGEAAPGFPEGTVSTFHSRPTMLGSGRSYWVGGFNENGGATTHGRMLYTSSDNQPGNATVVLRSDDVIEGLPISRPSGIDFDYDMSADGVHHIHVLLLETGSTVDDGLVYVDGTVAAREASPSGGGDNWDNFDVVTINTAGNYMFTGDTDGSLESDEFVAYNGMIVLREGDTVADYELGATAVARLAALNNDNSAVYAWEVDGGEEALFFACDASNLVNTSTLVLRTGVDGFDFDKDEVEDAVLIDLKASSSNGQAVSLGDDGALFLEVEIDDGKVHEANIRLELPSCCGDGIVQAGREACDDANDVQTDACPACSVATCGDGFLFEGEEECDDGNDIDTDACPTSCVMAVCGDGFVREGVEACDDGNDDDSDACLSSCESASCGDGFVYEEAEECDDGNLNDGDGCDANCQDEGGPETTAGPTDTDTDSDTDPTEASDTDVTDTDSSETRDSDSDSSETSESDTEGSTESSTTEEPTSSSSMGETSQPTSDPTAATTGSETSETETSEDTSASASGGTGVDDSGGCNCQIRHAPLPNGVWVVLAGLIPLSLRRRRSIF